MGKKKPEDDSIIDLSKGPETVEEIDDFLNDDFMVVLVGRGLVTEEMGVVEEDADKEFTKEAWRRVNLIMDKTELSADDVREAIKMAADFKWKAIIGVGIDATPTEIEEAEKVWNERTFGNFRERISKTLIEGKKPIEE